MSVTIDWLVIEYEDDGQDFCVLGHADSKSEAFAKADEIYKAGDHFRYKFKPLFGSKVLCNEYTGGDLWVVMVIDTAGGPQVHARYLVSRS